MGMQPIKTYSGGTQKSMSGGDSAFSRGKLKNAIENLTIKYSVVRKKGQDSSTVEEYKLEDIKNIVGRIEDEVVGKVEAIKIVAQLKLHEAPNSLTPDQAFDILKEKASLKDDVENLVEEQSKQQGKKKSKVTSPLASKEERIKLGQQKKGQYSNDAYTGNGTVKPDQDGHIENLEISGTPTGNPDRYKRQQPLDKTQEKTDEEKHMTEEKPPNDVRRIDEQINALKTQISELEKKKVEAIAMDVAKQFVGLDDDKKQQLLSLLAKK